MGWYPCPGLDKEEKGEGRGIEEGEEAGRGEEEDKHTAINSARLAWHKSQFNLHHPKVAGAKQKHLEVMLLLYILCMRPSNQGEVFK